MLAMHAMPGTSQLVFGQKGGLHEILYAATGFLHVRREVYETMQQKLSLPTCNERFQRPLVPFFQPLVKTDERGAWYLSEDFSFCERARQCGYRIMADTRIRLYHIGSYQYSWEEAGDDQKRYPTYTYHIHDGQEFSPAPPIASPWQIPGFVKLRELFPWSNENAPNSNAIPSQPIMDKYQQVLARNVSTNTRLVLHLGSRLDGVLSFLADRLPDAALIGIHPWKQTSEISAAWWKYRDRLLPLSASHNAGLKLLHENQLVPDVVVMADEPTYDSLRADVAETIRLFPHAKIIGGDWHLPDVNNALRDEIASRGWKVETNGFGWSVRKGG